MSFFVQLFNKEMKILQFQSKIISYITKKLVIERLQNLGVTPDAVACSCVLGKDT